MQEKEKIKIEIIDELKELKRRITEVQSIKEGADTSGISGGNYLEKLKMQKQILEEIHDGIISAGSDGYITGWNKSAETITGYKQEEVIGKHFSIFYDNKDRDFLENYITSGEKNIRNLKVEMKKKSGETFHSNLSVSSIKNSKGSREGIICYFSDMSEYNEIEDSSKRKNLQEKEFSEELEKLQEEMKQEKELSEELKKELSGEVEKLHEKVKKEKQRSEELKKQLEGEIEKLQQELGKEKAQSEELKKQLEGKVEKLQQELEKEKARSEELKKQFEGERAKLQEKAKKEKELSKELKKQLSGEIEKLQKKSKKEKAQWEELKKQLEREIEKVRDEGELEKLREEGRKQKEQWEELQKQLEGEVEKLREQGRKEKELSEELKKDLASGVEKLYEELNKEKELITALKKEKELTAELKTTITSERKNFQEEMDKKIELLLELNNTICEERAKFKKELTEKHEVNEEMQQINEKLTKELTEKIETLEEEIKKEQELRKKTERILEEVKKEREFTEEQKKALEEMKKEINQRKRSQKTLQENKFTLEMAQKISRIGYWSYNIQNHMYDWSDEMFNILGCPAERGVPSYEDCMNIMLEDDWQKFDRAFKKAVNTGESYNMDLKIIFPDRSIHYVNTRACPLYDKDNKITALFGVMQDITERKLLEEELKKSLNNLYIKNQIAGLFLTVSSENISCKVLPAMMNSLKSIYGLFGVIDSNGNLVKTTGYVDRNNHLHLSDGIIIKRELWSDSLKEILFEGKTCFSNTPVSEGDIQIKRSLSVPLFRNGKPSGILTVANKEEDYKEEDKILLQRIAELISPVLYARLESNRLKAELNGLDYQIKKAQKVEADLIQNILLR